MENQRNGNRKSIRLKGYDYSQEGMYFITLCCRDRKHLFGSIQNGIMCLNAFGSIAYQTWMETPSIRLNIALGAFIVMPDHLHGIIEIKEAVENANNENIGKFRSPSQTIGAIIRGYKGATTKRIKEYSRGELHCRGELQFARTELMDLDKSIWQRNYYEHIIRNDRALYNITNYIINNPQEWKKDKHHS